MLGSHSKRFALHGMGRQGITQTCGYSVIPHHHNNMLNAQLVRTNDTIAANASKTAQINFGYVTKSHM